MVLISRYQGNLGKIGASGKAPNGAPGMLRGAGDSLTWKYIFFKYGCLVSIINFQLFFFVYCCFVTNRFHVRFVFCNMLFPRLHFQTCRYTGCQNKQKQIPIFAKVNVFSKMCPYCLAFVKVFL